MSTQLVNQTTPKTKRPPLASGLPFVGSILPLMRDANQFFFSQYLRLGSLYRVRVLGQEFKVLAGPEANLLLMNNQNEISNWEVWEPIIKEFGGRHVLTMMEGKDHARLRKLMRQSFSRDTIHNNAAAIVNMTRQMLRAYPDGHNIPVVYFMQKLIATELGLLTNGQSPDAYFDDIMTYWNTMIEVYIANLKTEKELLKPRYQEARQRVEEFARQVLAERQAIPSDQRDPKNFLDQLLTTRETDPEFISEQEMVFSVLIAYFAGIDTAANISTFMLYELMRNPELWERARAEANKAFANGMPDAAALREMKVIHAAAMETLRLYPVAGVMSRYAGEDFTFAGYPIRKGEQLMVATCAAHFDPQYFPNPHTFDIERFSAPRNEHKTRGVYAPYGAGIHTCLGASVADAQIALTIATILHDVDLAFARPGYKLKIAYSPGMTAKDFAVRITNWRGNS